MRAVEAPTGYEGCVYWQDGTRSWMVAFRRVGATWWTNIGCTGHVHLLASEVDARAAEMIARAVAAEAMRS